MCLRQVELRGGELLQMVAGMAVRERQGFGAYYCPAFVARVFVITYSCEEPGNVVASSASCNFVLICLCTYLLASPSMALNAEGSSSFTAPSLGNFEITK